MSIIQKLENSYVAILRVVVIIAATVLLVVAAIFGIMAVKGLTQKAKEKIEVVSVDPNEVLATVAPDKKPIAADDRQQSAVTTTARVNPYLADYNKIFAATSVFASTTSKNTVKVDKESLFKFLDENLTHFESDSVKARYISGLAASFSTSLSDKRLIARVEKPLAVKARPVVAAVSAPVTVQGEGEEAVVPASAPEPVVEETPYKESPFVIIDEVLTAYNKIFNQKLVEANDELASAGADLMLAKANASMQMYLAAGMFGAFLLVIFLTVAIRIERNLRVIASRP